MLPEKESCLHIPTVAPVTRLSFPPQNGLGNLGEWISMRTGCGWQREMQIKVKGAQRAEKRHLMLNRWKIEEDKGVGRIKRNKVGFTQNPVKQWMHPQLVLSTGFAWWFLSLHLATVPKRWVLMSLLPPILVKALQKLMSTQQKHNNVTAGISFNRITPYTHELTNFKGD